MLYLFEHLSIKSTFKNVNIIFGEGYRVYTSDTVPENINSEDFIADIGYINDLYMGGLIYITFLYLSIVLFTCIGMNKEKDKKINKIIYFIMLLMIFICNIKGEIFRSTIILDLVVYMKLILCNANFLKRSD